MRPKILIWLPVIGLMTTAASPALAQANWYGGAAPSYSYQAPDGTYDSYSDLTRSIRGIPCGVTCTQRAAVRWGQIPPPPHHHPYYAHY